MIVIASIVTNILIDMTVPPGLGDAERALRLLTSDLLHHYPCGMQQRVRD